MQIVGRKRQRGRAFDHMGIELFAALHLAQADAFAGHRQIIVAQEVAQPFMRGVKLFRLGFVGRGQSRLVCRREILGEGLHRFHEHRIRQRNRQQRVELLDNPVDGQPGFDHTRFHPLTRACYRAVGDRDIVVMTAEVVLVIGDRLELRRAIATGEVRVKGVEAGEMVDRAHFGQFADFVGLAAQRRFLIILEHVIGQLIGFTQLRPVDLREKREIELGIGPRCKEHRIGEIVS